MSHRLISLAAVSAALISLSAPASACNTCGAPKPPTNSTSTAGPNQADAFSSANATANGGTGTGGESRAGSQSKMSAFALGFPAPVQAAALPPLPECPAAGKSEAVAWGWNFFSSSSSKNGHEAICQARLMHEWLIRSCQFKKAALLTIDTLNGVFLTNAKAAGTVNPLVQFGVSDVTPGVQDFPTEQCVNGVGTMLATQLPPTSAGPAPEAQPATAAPSAPIEPEPVVSKAPPRAPYSASVHFPVGLSDVSPDAQVTIRTIARYAVDMDGSVTVSAGHADSTGPDRVNMALSMRRAESVVAHLIANGVPRKSISIEAYGESKPIATNSTAAGRRENRRVEVTVSAK